MEKTNTFDIIIIGGGPSGLTAAIYGSRAGRKVLVLEKMTTGGQLSITPDIENYPGVASLSGFELSDIMRKQAEQFGASIVYASASEIDIKNPTKKITANGVTYTARTVILCMGAASRKLGHEKEEKLAGRGISYCATCDGAFFRGQTVAVVGGGNTAVEDALYLARIAEKVYLIHRREEFRASPAVTAHLNGQPNIELVLNSVVTDIMGDKFVTGVEVTDKAGIKKHLEVSALFVATGRTPSTSLVSNAISLNESGYIKVKTDMSTNIDGVFAAGDITEKHLRQVVTACSDGAIAAESASIYLTSLKG